MTVSGSKAAASPVSDLMAQCLAIDTIEEIVRLHSRLHGERPVATFDDQTFTYAQMDERSNRLANGLIAAGVKRNERIAVILKNGHLPYETLFGARKAGAVQVAVNWRLAPAEMAYIINDAQATLLIVDPEFVGHVAQIAAEVKHPLRVFVAGPPPAGVPYEDYEAWLLSQSAVDPGLTSGPDDVALQLYTSGTTGRPKGAMLSNGNLCAYFRSSMEAHPLPPLGVHLIVLPLFHVGGLVWSLAGMSRGGHCVGQKDFQPESALQLIPRYGITDSIMVPAVLQMMVNAANPETTDFSTLKVIVYGGSLLTAKLARAAVDTFDCTIYGMYGATEVSFGITLLFIDDDISPELLESVGRPLPGTEMRIVDPLTLKDVPDDVMGEVWIRSAQVGRGYWNLPQDTAEVFRSDGWFRSGDMGALRDGNLYLRDRLKDMIKSGGENVYPAEVERALTEHAAVEDCVVIGVPDSFWGESVKAIVTLAPGASVELHELIAFSRARLAHYKCPKSIDVITQMPRTATGKIARRELREPYWANQDRQIG